MTSVWKQHAIILYCYIAEIKPNSWQRALYAPRSGPGHAHGTAQIRRGQATFRRTSNGAEIFALPRFIATPTQQTYHFVVTDFEIAHLYPSRRRLLFETQRLKAELLSVADLDLVIRLNNACCDFFLFQNGLPPSEADAREIFEFIPARSGGATKLPIGIFLSEELIGVMDVLRGYRTASEWYLGFMLFAPSFRSQGFGTEVHSEFVSHDRRAGALRLLLAVLEENESARRFWLRLGYRKVKGYPPKPFGNRFHACTEFEMVL
jgi:RimJ/RimL family protein N-acetyltransferase